MITQKLSLALIDLAKEKGNKKLEKKLWNTYHCRSKIYSSYGRLYGDYCKNRICAVCCGIRKAETIRKYLPIVQTWSCPQFVTLTVKACKAKDLKKIMDRVMRAFYKIANKHRKRHQRATGIKFVGIKSLECNFNPMTKTYNPHLHLIVATEEMAILLKKEWLKIWTRKYTYNRAQKIIPINPEQKEKTLIEIIKYGSKIFTELDPNNKNPKATRSIYVAAFFNILLQMEGKRLFERFGFNLPAKSIKTPKKKLIVDFEECKHCTRLNDWVNETEQLLTGYLPSYDLIEMLTNKMNKELT